jgi:hypothetical protein
MKTTMKKYAIILMFTLIGSVYAQTPIPGTGAIFTCTVAGYEGAADQYACNKGFVVNLLDNQQTDCHMAENTGSWTNAPPPNSSWFDFNVHWKLPAYPCVSPFEGNSTIGYTPGPLVCPPTSTQESITNGIPVCYCAGKTVWSDNRCRGKSTLKDLIVPNH